MLPLKGDADAAQLLLFLEDFHCHWGKGCPLGCAVHLLTHCIRELWRLKDWIQRAQDS